MTTDKGARTSARLAESMLELIQTRGYGGTGLNTVVEHADAPKGSLYFHFPDGKEGLGARAVDLAAQRFRGLLDDAALASASAGEVVARVADVLADLLTASDFQTGCPVSVVVLETGARSERLRAACAEAFAAWIDPVAEYLAAGGTPPDTAHSLATAAVSAVEGAMIVSRAQRSVAPLRHTARALVTLLDGAQETDR